MLRERNGPGPGRGPPSRNLKRVAAAEVLEEESFAAAAQRRSLALAMESGPDAAAAAAAKGHGTTAATGSRDKRLRAAPATPSKAAAVNATAQATATAEEQTQRRRRRPFPATPNEEEEEAMGEAMKRLCVRDVGKGVTAAVAAAASLSGGGLTFAATPNYAATNAMLKELALERDFRQRVAALSSSSSSSAPAREGTFAAMALEDRSPSHHVEQRERAEPQLQQQQERAWDVRAHRWEV